jgi:hypothetical protein
MWNKKVNNYICNYLDEYEIQKKHIERILSAKEIINNKKPPYCPKFLKLKLYNLLLKEKYKKIKEENKILFYKIINAETKPSKYSRIYEPKICPSFDKNNFFLKRIKKEAQKSQENQRFYQKIEKVKSYYDHKEMTKRNKYLDSKLKRLHKSILELQPSLLFLSPNNAKNEIKKYKHITYDLSKTKRSNSCCYRETSISSVNKKRNSSTINNKKNNKLKKESKDNSIISNENSNKKFSTINANLSGRRRYIKKK